MSPGHESRRKPSAQERGASSSADAADRELPPDALREIVAQTAESLAAHEQVDPLLRQAMIDVARRFAGEPITIDRAGTALIEAVLRRQLPPLADRPSLLAHTARIVASSLLNDPAARIRLEHLWARLAEDAE